MNDNIKEYIVLFHTQKGRLPTDEEIHEYLVTNYQFLDSYKDRIEKVKQRLDNLKLDNYQKELREVSTTLFDIMLKIDKDLEQVKIARKPEAEHIKIENGKTYCYGRSKYWCSMCTHSPNVICKGPK
jgi:transcriptional regulator of heat shock response